MKAASWRALAGAALFVGVLSAACGEAPGDGRGAAARDTRGCPADLRRLLPGQPDAHGPSWSPDGRRIAFTATSGGRQGLYVMAVSDCRIEPIRPRGGNVWFDFPDWSPDGRLIAFVGNPPEPEQGGIYVMRPNGSGVRHVTRGPDLFPAWSPNGRRIAFVRALSIEEGAANDERNVWTVNGDGSGLRQVTHGEWQWSPDGEWITFTDDLNTTDVWIVRQDGTGARQLTRSRKD